MINLNKSLYRTKQASENWFDIIKNGIEIRGYHQSIVYTYILYRKESVLLNRVDDFLIVSHKQNTIT